MQKRLFFKSALVPNAPNVNPELVVKVYKGIYYYSWQIIQKDTKIKWQNLLTQKENSTERNE